MNIVDIGSIVKINPEVFGTNPREADIYGDFGYAGITRHLNFQVQRIEDYNGKGKLAYCTVINPAALVGIGTGADEIKEVIIEGEMIILLKDLVLTVVKVTLDYIVAIERIDNNAVLAQLWAERKRLKNSGRKVSDTDLKINWKAIQDVRSLIEKGTIQYVGTTAKVTLPKQRMVMNIDSNLLPNETEESIFKFKTLLIRKIKQHRAGLKIMKYERKQMYNDVLMKLGGVYTQEGQPMKAYERSLLTTLRDDKVPKTRKDTYIGVEIEFVHLNDVPLMEELFIKAKLHKNVQLTKDDSVQPCHNNKAYKGSELRILATVNDMPDVLARVSRVLLDPRIDGYVNRSCGLHVHLDMRKRDIALVYKNFFRIQNLLKASQPVGRTNSHFCVPNMYEEYKKPQPGLMKPKYALINPNPYLEERGTLEIRVHEGAIEAEQITHWVMFLNTIADYEELLPAKKFKSLKEVSKIIDLPKPCIEYVDGRIEKFGQVV